MNKNFHSAFIFNVNAEAGYTVGMGSASVGFAYEAWDHFTSKDSGMAALFILLAVATFYLFARHLPYMLRTDFLRVISGGIEFRNLGFIPWERISQISQNEDGLVFMFAPPEAIKISNNYFRRVWRRGDQMLMVLRSKKVSIDTATPAILYALKMHYISYLDPTHDYNVDTPIEALEGRLAQEKRSIKFGEEYQDIVSNFNQIHIP